MSTLLTRLDFPESRSDAADLKAQVLNAYIDHGFSFKAVVESGLISKTTLWRYLGDDDFKEALGKIVPAVVAEAKDTQVELMRHPDPAVKDRASRYLLEAYETATFDAGVRKQIAANQGNWLSQLLNNKLEANDTKHLDPFVVDGVTLPDNTRNLAPAGPVAIEGPQNSPPLLERDSCPACGYKLSGDLPFAEEEKNAPRATVDATAQGEATPTQPGPGSDPLEP